MSDSYTLYTDGGANPNPGLGGWGVVAVNDGEIEYELSGAEPATTNNRMELTAAIAALESRPRGADVRVVTDSQYLRQGITNWIVNWKRNGWMRGRPPKLEPVLNADLWKQLDTLTSERAVTWSWVKGHAGNRFNERADELATRQIQRLRSGSMACAEHTGARSASSTEGPTDDVGTPDCVATIAVRFARGRGRWAARLARPGSGDAPRTIRSPELSASSANRLELLAGVELLTDELSPTERVEIECGDYLRRGATEWLRGWKSSGWRTAGGDEVKNRDLWRELDSLLGARQIEFRKIDSKSPLVKQLKADLR